MRLTTRNSYLYVHFYLVNSGIKAQLKNFNFNPDIVNNKIA